VAGVPIASLTIDPLEAAPFEFLRALAPRIALA
jgi:hypothetical protein